MSVCIAALYRNDEGDPGIALCADWQLTDTKTGMTAEMAPKVQYLGEGVVALGADDMVKFGDLCQRLREKIERGGVQDIRDVVRKYLDAEGEWREEHLERHVLRNFGLTWKSLFEKLANDELPASFVDNVQRATENYSTPYSNDAIIAGFDNDGPHIWRCTPESKDDHTPMSYAIIGAGHLVAHRDFEQASYNEYQQKGAVTFLCYMAKRHAEVIDSVGKNHTSLWTMEKGDVYCNPVQTNIRLAFEEQYDKLCDSETIRRDNVYEQAIKIYKELAKTKSKGAKS